MANPNGGLPNGRNMRIATNGTGAGQGAKVDPSDPQVRKLVYNMYRGLLDQKHQKANVIVDNAPQEKVLTDEGVGSRVESMMRQQSELKGGNMNAGGPPPPPPPPPIPGVLPTSRLPSEIPAVRLPVMNHPPAALAGAMMKDKKPFTYTPGGLDLSEIKAQNGDPSADPGAPVQSRSFRLLQNVLDTDTADGPINGVPMKVEVPPGQKMATNQRSFVSVPQGGYGSTSADQNGSYKIIPVPQTYDDGHFNSKHIGGYKGNASNPNQLSSIFKNQVRVSSDNDEARSRGGYFPAKNVVVTQRIEPQGPVHIPTLRQPQAPQQKPHPAPYQNPNVQHYQPPNYQQPGHYQQPGQFQPQFQQQAGGPGSTGASEQEIPEPKKYMGGNIPSRSFRILQAMTSPEDASDNGVPGNASESTQPPPVGDKQHAANQIPSPTWKSTNPSSPTSLSPPSTTLNTTNDISSDSGISSPSKVSPTYTTTNDSKVYRNVAPKISMNGPKRERVVNSALSSQGKEPSSPFANCSSPSWKVNQPKFFPPVSGQKIHQENQEPERESPRLMKIIRQEPTAPENPEIIEKRYEGAHIPSRVFRHLQSEYPSDGQDSKPQFEGGSIPPRVIRSLQSENNTSVESDAELDEYYSNGASKTATHKDTVLKELTSQFDHMGTRKKPKAAPGRVFKYLQQQYDTPDDSPQPQEANNLRPEAEEIQDFGYRGSKLPSPSFRFLQNQYQQDQQEEVVQEESPTPDAPQYEEEPTPYRGARLPGRTFRSIQENGAAHPSALKPRK